MGGQHYDNSPRWILAVCWNGTHTSCVEEVDIVAWKG